MNQPGSFICKLCRATKISVALEKTVLRGEVEGTGTCKSAGAQTRQPQPGRSERKEETRKRTDYC